MFHVACRGAEEVERVVALPHLEDLDAELAEVVAAVEIHPI